MVLDGFNNDNNSNAIILNSIIAGNRRIGGEESVIQIFDHGGKIHSYNNLFCGYMEDGFLDTEENTIYQLTAFDPFVNHLAQDFSLLDVSEAIGAGISSLEFEGVTLNSPLTDLNGGSRPFPDG